MPGGIEFLVFGRKKISSKWTPSTLVGLSKLYYIYGGSAYYNGNKLEAGHLCIFPDCRGVWELSGEFDHLYFDFFMTPPLLPGCMIDICVDDHPEIRAVCDAASTIFTLFPRENIRNEAGLILELLLDLCDRIHKLRSTGDERIDRAIGYICGKDNITDGRQLAGLVHLDRYYFLKLFRKKTGMTPGKYARLVKLGRAAAMLEEGASVSETAAAVGFASDTAFVGAFRKCFGTTPGKIHKKVKEESKCT